MLDSEDGNEEEHPKESSRLQATLPQAVQEINDHRKTGSIKIKDEVRRKKIGKESRSAQAGCGKKIGSEKIGCKEGQGKESSSKKASKKTSPETNPQTNEATG
ncbi:MAG TPA: hypothetical protein VKZ53_07335 [Candidatus Angelobacter sp.]|nr:hypothetical protein [Candidatus Angelobacter sp.]